MGVIETFPGAANQVLQKKAKEENKKLRGEHGK